MELAAAILVPAAAAAAAVLAMTFMDARRLPGSRAAVEPDMLVAARRHGAALAAALRVARTRLESWWSATGRPTVRRLDADLDRAARPARRRALRAVQRGLMRPARRAGAQAREVASRWVDALHREDPRP